MIQNNLKKHFSEFLEAEITKIKPVSGGSINKAAEVMTESGENYFLKWNSAAASDMFEKEKKGLQLLASAQTDLHIPNVIKVGKAGDTDYILMEMINENRGDKQSSENFGRALAKLHKVTTQQYGLEYDNYIGRLEQPNRQTENWIDFFVELRLDYQLKKAVDDGKLGSRTLKNFQQLYKKLPDLLPQEPASLLHGDLWGGNYFFDENGEAAIFDPAVYYGNREIEIAFTHLFGGFDRAFYESYQDTFPLEPNFGERKDIYNLYPLLVHTNMFGGHYGRQVQGLVQNFT